MNKNKGFTLIELLVVIAIIGILASVVLASLSSARDKGKDASVKSQLASMKAQAELYFSSNGLETYAGICTAAQSANGFGGTAGPGLLKAASDSVGISNTINIALDVAGSYNSVTCHESVVGVVDAWAVDAPMSDSTSTTPHMYCTDSTGVSKDNLTTFLAADDVTC